MERRRQQRKTKQAAVSSEEEPMRRGYADVPYEVLRLIFLRLDSPIWLLRAACACKRWHRAVTDGADAGRAFLRQASSLHAPVVLGHYRNYDDTGRCFVPSSPPPPVDGSRFILDFLPEAGNHGNSRWKVVECHGGLVLLRYIDTLNLIVCDPLARRYQGICSPTVRPVQQAARRADECSFFPDVFLLDGNDGQISVSNFRVVYWSDDHGNKRSSVYVFSTQPTGGGDYWRSLRQSELDYSYRYGNSGVVVVAGRVDGSPYLSLATGSLVALDSASLEFSKVDLPIRVKRSSLPPLYKLTSAFAVVHGGAGPDFASPRTTARIVHVLGDELELFRRVRGSGEWMLEQSIPSLQVASHGLPGCSSRCWYAVDVAPGDTGLAVLKVYLDSVRRWRFAMDVNTMELQALPDEVAHLSELRTWPETFNYTFCHGLSSCLLVLALARP